MLFIIRQWDSKAGGSPLSDVRCAIRPAPAVACLRALVGRPLGVGTWDATAYQFHKTVLQAEVFFPSA